MARFQQVNKDKPNVHHDALEFPNGQIVVVTRLCEGQPRAAIASCSAHCGGSGGAKARFCRRVVGWRAQSTAFGACRLAGFTVITEDFGRSPNWLKMKSPSGFVRGCPELAI